MSKKRDDAMRDFFEVHLPYEMWMLTRTYERLQSPNDDDMNNALIESFSVHARNLIEFFKTKEGCDFDPRDFTRPNYTLKKRFVKDSVLQKINAQISHLSAQRTTDADEKINTRVRKEAYEALTQELARFLCHLTSAYAQRWKELAAVEREAVAKTIPSSSAFAKIIE